VPLLLNWQLSHKLFPIKVVMQSMRWLAGNPRFRKIYSEEKGLLIEIYKEKHYLRTTSTYTGNR
jgi:hypothetical protein